jgi:uncharacterized protein
MLRKLCPFPGVRCALPRYGLQAGAWHRTGCYGHDVLDHIEEVADTFVLYRIEAPTSVAVQQAAIIVRQCEQIHEALEHLRGFRNLEKYWIEVHRLENEGDKLARTAMAGLFQDGTDPIEIIKWKDVYGGLEQTVDRCEDVANIIERIVVKHA